MYSHETSIYHAIIITAITIGCILGYGVYSLYRQHRKNVYDQRLDLSNEIKTLETERSRVSRDIHDDAGSLIGLVRAYLNEVTTVSDADKINIEKANDLLDELVKRLTAISVNLSPKSLMRKGLEYTLKDFLEETEGSTGLMIEFIFDVKREIGVDERIHLFRIIQEITHNAVKHAKAKVLTVHFKEKNQMLYVWCKDDGVGFDPEYVQEEKEGMGLRSLRSRTEILEGKLTIKSKQKHGTEYFFAFPFKGTRADHQSNYS